MKTSQNPRKPLQISYDEYPIKYHLRWESLTKSDIDDLLDEWYTDPNGKIDRKEIQLSKKFNSWFKQTVSEEFLDTLLEDYNAVGILYAFVQLFKESPHYINKGITQLYRYYKDDVLLYIGVSLNTIQRQMQHRDMADWYTEVTNMTVENFSTRNEALNAEKEAIIKEKPLYNKIHNNYNLNIK